MVGWSMGEQMTSDLVIAALNIALHTRGLESVIHHSDQGIGPMHQRGFRKPLSRDGQMGVRPSMA